jgi:hypothetical protein
MRRTYRMIVLTAILAVASIAVLNLVRSRMIAAERSLQTAATEYATLKRVYSPVGNRTQPLVISVRDSER